MERIRVMAVRPLKTLLQLRKQEINMTSTKDDEVKNSRGGSRFKKY